MSSLSFQVELDFFSGPLDLLLHLVRKQELPIAEVEISPVLDQYLRIIEEAQTLDLDIATEYLVVAATLISIKSDAVLSERLRDEDQVEYEEDPFGELREQIRRYELFKGRASELRERPQLDVSTFTRIDHSFSAPESDQIEIEEEPQFLGFTFVQLLKRIGQGVRSLRVHLEAVTVLDCMMGLIDSLKAAVSTGGSAAGRSSFFAIVASRVGAEGLLPVEAAETSEQKHVRFVKRRGFVTAHFVATLELVKRGVLSVTARRGSGDFTVALELADAPIDGLADRVEVQGADDLKVVSIDDLAQRRNEAIEDENQVERQIKQEVNRE